MKVRPGVAGISAFFLAACAQTGTRDESPFPVHQFVSSSEWITYEGRWKAATGTIHFELSLMNGSPGQDAQYRLKEKFEAKDFSGGTTSSGAYSSARRSDGEHEITLHGVNSFEHGNFFRHNPMLQGTNSEYEIHLVSRGNDELLPCDDTYVPITTDWRYSLHKRSDLFTVEGYFTLERDSIDFFERNTRRDWKVAPLGEFEAMRKAYPDWAKEKHEGVYVRALAFSVADSAAVSESGLLVIKDIKSIGVAPDE